MKYCGLAPGGRPPVEELTEMRKKAVEYDVLMNELIDFKNLVL